MPPANLDARIALAFQHLKAGRMAAAEKVARELTAQGGRDPRPQALLARVLNLAGRPDEAGVAVAAALALDPGFPPALIEQAQLARARGEHAQAAEALGRLVAAQPANPALGYDHAVSLLELDRVDEAERELWRVLGLAPGMVEARFKLGHVEVRRGHSAQALEHFAQCCALRPNWIEPWLNRGAMLMNLEQARAAAEAYGRALELDPDNVYALEGYASAERERGGNLDRIIQARLRVCEKHPDSPMAWVKLAFAYNAVDLFEQQAAASERALELDPHCLIARYVLFQEPRTLIHQDRASQLDFARRWKQGLAYFEQVDLSLPAHREHLPMTLGRGTNFYLHYVGEPFVDLQRRYAAMIARLAHAVVAPRPFEPPPARGDARLRVGFVSPSLRRHTVSKLFRAFIEGLPRDRYSIELFHCGDLEDEVTAALRSVADHYEHGNLIPVEWIGKIRARRLDALLFLDVGMSPTPQVLASYRLAPLQAMFWGHPVTSGSPNMDLYFTSDAMEAEGGERHYVEQVVRLPNLGISFAPPDREPDPSLEIPALRETGTVHYLLAQSVFKLGPEHDDMLARIAEQVPNARFSLVPHQRQHVRDELARRMRRAFEARGLDMDRLVHMFPALHFAQYLRVAQSADVNLDSLGWSGGNSTLEITWFDVPSVSLPGELMRSRHTAAMLKLMGLDALIARDLDDYVRIAVELGRDDARRAALRAQVRERKHVLYGDPTPVRAFREVLEREIMLRLPTRDC